MRDDAPGDEDGFRFDPDTYAELMAREVPHYDELQDTIAEATATAAATATGDGRAVRALLDLGSGTGETLLRVLARHPGARATGVDENDRMLAVARDRLAAADPVAAPDLREADLLDPLPAGPFDLVTSALAIHHLDGPGKAELFRRIAAALAPGGRFVLGDVVIPDDPTRKVVPEHYGYDKPDTVRDQVRWLEEAGFAVAVPWQADDLAVFVAAKPREPPEGPARPH